MALSMVYFRITHRLGRPYYLWDENLYSVLEKVEVRVTVSVTVCVVYICVVRDDDERKGEGETWCRLIACSSRKAPRGPPGNNIIYNNSYRNSNSNNINNISAKCKKI